MGLTACAISFLFVLTRVKRHFRISHCQGFEVERECRITVLDIWWQVVKPKTCGIYQMILDL